MNDEIPEWALIEAYNRVWREDVSAAPEKTDSAKVAYAREVVIYRQLAAMIAKYEPQPVDPLIAEAEDMWRRCSLAIDREEMAFVELLQIALKRGMELAPKGWIKHDGKGCPVYGDTQVKLCHRNGEVSEGLAGQSSWYNDDSPYDIVFYQVLS